MKKRARESHSMFEVLYNVPFGAVVVLPNSAAVVVVVVAVVVAVALKV